MEEREDLKSASEGDVGDSASLSRHYTNYLQLANTKKYTMSMCLKLL